MKYLKLSAEPEQSCSCLHYLLHSVENIRMLEDEPLISPAAARAYLTNRSDVVELDGRLEFTRESVPHLGMAALLNCER